MVAIVWPDVEAEFIGYMAPALDERPEPYAADVMVRNRVPNESATQPWPTSKRLVVVRFDGGPTTRDVRATARLGVQVWGASEEETTDLANLLVALMGGWRSPTVRASNPTLPAWVTEESKRPKKYFTAELTIRGRALPAA